MTVSSGLFVATIAGVFTLGESGVWQSRSSGLPPNELDPFVADPFDGDVLYVGTAGGGVYATADRGITWAPAGLENLWVNALAADPTQSGVLFAAGGGLHTFPSLWKSTDFGRSWTQEALASANGIGLIAIDPGNPQRLYVGFGTGIVRSDDGGSSWRALGGSSPNALISTSRLVVEPDGRWIHAATFSDGVFDLRVARPTRGIGPR